jgi:hypothetical protein
LFADCLDTRTALHGANIGIATRPRRLPVCMQGGEHLLASDTSLGSNMRVRDVSGLIACFGLPSANQEFGAGCDWLRREAA